MFVVVPIGVGEVKVKLIKVAETLQKFVKLSSIEKKKLVVKHLGIKVDKLFPEDDKDEEMVDNQKVLNPGE